MDKKTRERYLVTCRKLITTDGMCATVKCCNCPGNAGRVSCVTTGWSSGGSMEAPDPVVVRNAQRFVKENTK